MTDANYIPQLKTVLETITDASVSDIPSVVEIDSRKPGPTVGIIACTHGNEPVGLAAINYLLSDLVLLSGRLYFIIANPKAAEHYFSAQNADECEAARYVEKNLNRLPPRDELGDSDAYELQRAAQLLPILEQLDGVLDLHSTSSNAPAMLIAVDEASAGLAQDALFPFEHVITHIHAHLGSKFLIEYCDKARVKLLAECGQHECLDASQRAIDISLAFLHQMGVVEDMQAPDIQKQVTRYRAKQAVYLPEDCGEFRLRAVIEPFEFVEKGQVLACNGTDREVAAPESGYAIMCPETRNCLDCTEALLFLCDKEE